MVGDARPVQTAMHVCQLHAEAAHVDAVQVQHRQHGGKAARRDRGRRSRTPRRRPARGSGIRLARRVQSLKSPAMISGASCGTRRSMRLTSASSCFSRQTRSRPRCTLIACSRWIQPGTSISQCSRPRRSSRCMDTSSLSQRRIGNLRQDRVAVMGIVDHRVAAVGEVLPHRSRPGTRTAAQSASRRWRSREAGVEPDHFLQEHQVRLDRLQALPQIVQADAPLELREALVDVVGQDVQALHPISRRRLCYRQAGAYLSELPVSGSLRIAAALLQEKQRSRRLLPGQPHEAADARAAPCAPRSGCGS